jgi:hypothetical protein
MITKRKLMLGIGAGTLHGAYGRQVRAGGIVSFSDFVGTKKLDDYTELFQEALDQVSRRKAGVLLVPPGIYPLNTIKLPTGVVIEGAGRSATILSARVSEENGFVTLEPGPILNSGLRRLTLRGGTPLAPTNKGQWGARLISSAKPTGKPHGGLWWSVFQEVSIESFDNGFWLESGGDNYLLPHQFGSMRDVVIYGNRESPGPGFRLTGQVNQFDYSQLHIDNFHKVGIELLQSSSGKTSPKLHHFDMTTVQSADVAVSVVGAHNVSLSNCWFEGNGRGVYVYKDSFGISVRDSRFANSGKTGPAIEFEDGATGVIAGNVFAGRDTIKTAAVPTDGRVLVENNTTIWGANE